MDHNNPNSALIPADSDVSNAEDTSAFEKSGIGSIHAPSMVVAYVEETFKHIVDEIQQKPFGRPKIVLRRIKARRPLYGNSEMQLKWQVEDREAAYHFPGKNKNEAWHFSKLDERTILWPDTMTI